MNVAQLKSTMSSLTEDQITELLGMELLTTRRKSVVIRLHQRLVMLRADRERKQLLEQLK